jgi:hypothetical protein
VEIHRVNENGMIEGIERLRQRADRNARQLE